MEFEGLLEKARQLRQHGDRLLEMRSQLTTYKNRLAQAWDARETDRLEDMTDHLNRKINRTADEINGIALDLLAAYEKLAEEEELQKL